MSSHEEGKYLFKYTEVKNDEDRERCRTIDTWDIREALIRFYYGDKSITPFDDGWELLNKAMDNMSFIESIDFFNLIMLDRHIVEVRYITDEVCYPETNVGLDDSNKKLVSCKDCAYYFPASELNKSLYPNLLDSDGACFGEKEVRYVDAFDTCGKGEPKQTK